MVGAGAKESVRVGDGSAEGSRQSERGAAVAELGRQTVRGRSLGCGGDCTLHFQRNSTRVSGCAGSDRILQPAATQSQHQAACNGRVSVLTWRSCSDVW
jgi:hypothetical protein